MTLYNRKLQVPFRGKSRLLPLDEILYACWKDGKTIIHAKEIDGLWLAKPLKEVEETLVPLGFARVNHSTLVNLNHVTKLQGHPERYVLVSGTHRIDVSQRKYPHIRQLLTQR
ncbi:LytR/AlgR family response regulator transcription factor [Perlabentimonas gracilis]|uniref:LytR/AlgR family response regulator transcription factor n=1 Tax=Perlabentimonas gracilis TaxID=2715279 RepID=UPI00140C286E|nr:LytTR family DNA-binding domain-containing protein [Perlabentimonas gracilis]NHB69256.1 LytTR family transcriptional regulator [Perlabentimonas gracilis]